MSQLATFEQFWPHFLSSHRRPVTRFMHVAALGAAAVGMYAAVRRRRLSPLLIGGAAAFTLATAAHPLFEGNTPQNLGRPLWAARGFLRLCVRTVTGRISAEVADLPAADSAT